MAGKSIVWIEVAPGSNGGAVASIVTAYGGVCGVATAPTHDEAIALVSRSLRAPLPVRRVRA